MVVVDEGSQLRHILLFGSFLDGCHFFFGRVQPMLINHVAKILVKEETLGQIQSWIGRLQDIQHRVEVL